MSRRTVAADGSAKESSSAASNGAQEKQKMLLASDTGHFSLIRSVAIGRPMNVAADVLAELCTLLISLPK